MQATRLVQLARARGGRIAVAESLTGGRLADAIVSVPGASMAFSGGIVAYDTDLKHRLLGVDDALLRRVGPVDPEVARQMASGVRRVCAVPRIDEAGGGGAEPATLLGIATTGVAGPDPDPQSGQAPGTVWIGVSIADPDAKSGARVWAVPASHLSGSREDIRAAAVGQAVRLAECALQGEFHELE
ncbi:nicotinamide-nucleotide amidohydrolase family protein [Leucobacter tardus]|uniref:CinA family protein n=1 Tax=Leucobacter tardus TaxID=501483 RepID=A0A939QE48_9MICO|nr:CinA family protein [Leucobacter tardus]MBO2990470.1 CinA family protein [Leucobacter tardus]